MVLPGAVQGSDIRKIANLHDDMEATEFFRDISEHTPPSGSKKITAGLFPRESFSFGWKWQFHPPAAWVKNK